jgi:MFS transporter, YNFM family, putative membrane transport protein
VPPQAPAAGTVGLRSRASGALYAGTVAAYAAMYVTQPLLPELSRELAISPATAGLTVSAVVLFVALGSFVAGPLSDAVGRKRVMVGSLALLVIPTLACALSRDLRQLLAFRALQGLLIPGVTAVTVAWAGDHYAPRDLRAAVGGVIAASVAGGLWGRVASGLVAEHLGWRAAFLLSALVTALGALGMAVELPAGRGGGGAWRGAFAGMLRHLGDRRLLGGFLLAFCLFFGFIAVFTYLPFRLAGPPWRLSTDAVASAYLVYLAGIATSPVAGRWAGKVEPWRLMLGGLALGVVGMGLTLVPSLPVIVGGLLVLVVGMFTAQALGPSYVNEVAREAKGGASALYLASYYAGGTLGSWLPGLAWESRGWPGVVAVAITALLLAMVAVAMLCRPAPG